MSIVKSYSKQNDTTYVYEQDMKWNPVTKRPEGTRKLIGKIDPVTGDIIPTERRGRKKKEKTDSTSVPSDSELMKQNQKLLLEIDVLKGQLTELHAENDALLEKKISRIVNIASE